MLDKTEKKFIEIESRNMIQGDDNLDFMILNNKLNPPLDEELTVNN